jgi:Ser/Thr protein kinase RdoA (MazF antagonist)
MLAVRHLFDNRPLAEMLLANWDADAEQFGLYRISANAVYHFNAGEDRCVLRFAPASEKTADTVRAEIDFILYLRSVGYPAAEPCAGRSGQHVVERATPWGTYVATAFRAVPGEPLESTDLNENVVAEYGRMLGRLHRLSMDYRPAGARRRSYGDILAWICRVLPGEEPVQIEAAALAQYFNALPTSRETFGLVHYDFECDNVFWDEASGRMSVIDFDESMQHWYAMDVEQALHSLAREVPPEHRDHKSSVFMAGYAEEAAADDVATLRPACRRFADLFWYARVRHSLAERWDNEPDWLVDLRRRLHPRLVAASDAFGHPIPRHPGTIES